ncbi:MAG TPA: hypothetical protein PKA63_02140 [Oligoflexia bacterium]|nr:hypothetical protein [Oligoflexia bacterium]HMP47451.1 hypothetical protein [Oligoflexia bacterium]
MKTSKISNLIVLLLAAPAFLLADCLTPSRAEAGVLFRNRQMVIRTFVPQFQTQNYRVSKSTVALRKTSAPVTARPIGTVDQHMKLISSYNKYEQKLYKWETKQAKIAQKNAEKRRKLAEKEQVRKKRQAERLRREHERKQRKMELAAAKQQQGASLPAASVSSASSSSASRGALGTGGLLGSGQANPEKKKGFWASLFQSLFGRSFG